VFHPSPPNYLPLGGNMRQPPRHRAGSHGLLARRQRRALNQGFKSLQQRFDLAPLRQGGYPNRSGRLREIRSTTH